MGKRSAYADRIMRLSWRARYRNACRRLGCAELESAGRLWFTRQRQRARELDARGRVVLSALPQSRTYPTDGDVRMKLSQIRPCDNCGRKIAPSFYVARFSIALFNPRATNEVLGMTHTFMAHWVLLKSCRHART